ncbi:hypothetical protein [Frankia sp. Cas3]|uniref:hypothetical protein n=1 Tax=Frankia sp. Cas3 TaxID=3073926 RepID=UPI002AD34923|nr:hypothetical protein [Frankia sp. Cas3]
MNRIAPAAMSADADATPRSVPATASAGNFVIAVFLLIAILLSFHLEYTIRH